MLSMLLVYAAMWLVLCLGNLDKGDKFWTVGTWVITGIFAVLFVISFLTQSDSSLSPGSLTSLGMALGLGAVGSLIYVILRSKEILETKRFPVMAGVSVVLMNFGWLVIFFGLVHWLAKNGL